MATLTAAHPDRRIQYVPRADGRAGWWATRRDDPTAAERAAGALPSVARADAVALAVVLAVQDDIRREVRLRQGPADDTSGGRAVSGGLGTSGGPDASDSPDTSGSAGARWPDCRVFPATGASLGRARSWLADVLYGHSRRDDALLPLSEAFTNALLHTSSPEIAVLAVVDQDDTVRIEITDSGSSTVPHTCPGRQADPLAESGRGILLLRAEAARWGFTESGLCCSLWFELAGRGTSGAGGGGGGRGRRTPRP